MLATPLKSPCSAWPRSYKAENYFHLDAKERGLKRSSSAKTTKWAYMGGTGSVNSGAH